MAHNYLENQYEKYLARKAAWEKAKKHSVKRPVKTTVPSETLPNEDKSEPVVGNQPLCDR